MTTGNDPTRTEAERLLAELSKMPETHPAAALLSVDAQREALTTPFLEAVERGLADPEKSFSNEGVLFNYATYFLSKWREARAYPLFVRWFSLPGEAALELGGDTVVQSGARFLASICGGDLDPIKSIILNRAANPNCRGQAVKSLAVLVAWNERPREEIEGYYLFLAREGLERERGVVWDQLAEACLDIEALAVFPELRQAFEQGLIDTTSVKAEELTEVEQAPRGVLLKQFAQRHRPIMDIVGETRWWAGFQQTAALGAPGQPGSNRLVGQPGETYVAPAKTGRNDPCPCGSGKKFKKCCGS
jgi:hypothetical protein